MSEEHSLESDGDESENEESVLHEEESEESAEGFDMNIVHGFIDYALGYTAENMTLEGIKERVNSIPVDIIAEKIVEFNILHHYVGRSAACQPEGGLREEGWPPADIQLEVVQYLLELAPDAVNKVDDGAHYMGVAHPYAFPYGEGAYPLHLACFNADCPESVIKLLFEKNLSAVRHVGDKIGLPLCCYLQRAHKHPVWGYHDDDDGHWIEEVPAFPSGEIDHDIVKMLINAYPNALTDNALKTKSTPLSILCQGSGVSLELAQMLTDKDMLCLEVDEKSKDYSPIWTLLHNSEVSQFPDDVFRYLLECNPTSLEMCSDDVDEDDWEDCYRSQTALHLACSNPNMTAETVGLVIKFQPEIVKMECKVDGCLPLHTLCKNKNLGEQVSVDILQLLLDAYPESVKKKVGKGNEVTWIESDEGKSPIYLAEENNMSFGFIKALLSERARQSSIPGANILQIACIYRCSVVTIKKVVEDDPGLLLTLDKCGHFALHTAAKHASLEVVQYLVDGIKSLLPDGAHSTKAVKLLAEISKCTLTSKDNFGELPLHKACRVGNMQVVEYLMTKSMASVKTVNSENELAIHVLCNSRCKSRQQLRSVEYTDTIFKLLLANPEICQ